MGVRHVQAKQGRWRSARGGAGGKREGEGGPPTRWGEEVWGQLAAWAGGAGGRGGRGDGSSGVGSTNDSGAAGADAAAAERDVPHAGEPGDESSADPEPERQQPADEQPNGQGPAPAGHTVQQAPAQAAAATTTGGGEQAAESSRQKPEPSLRAAHESVLRQQLAALARRGQRAPAAVVADQRRRQHARTARRATPSKPSARKTSESQRPATAAGKGRAIAKQASWQQWRLVCVQAVLQRVRDAERRKKDRQAQAWADGQGAPDVRSSTGEDDDSSTASTADTSRPRPQVPRAGAAATHDTQTNRGDNNVNNNRPKRGANTVVSYDETNRRTRRRTPQERERYLRDRKRKNIALIPTGARIVRTRTDV